MSINRAALRIAAVLALRGRTSAGAAVFDSRADALEDVALGVNVPVISVYTEEDKTRDRRREVDLVIEFAVTSRVQLEGETHVIASPETDEALELTLDVLEAEITDALMAGASEAADLFNSLVPDIELRSSKRGVLAESKDRRLAARQLLFHCHLISDRAAGAPVPVFLTRLIALMQADDFYAPAAPGLEAFINRDFGWNQGTRDMGYLGFDRWSAKATGIVPDPENAAPLAELTFDGKTYTDEDAS
jgi:hypothetical protein